MSQNFDAHPTTGGDRYHITLLHVAPVGIGRPQSLALGKLKSRRINQKG